MNNTTTESRTALPCVLLVEDSATTKAVLSQYLSAHYRLLHASDGEEAWELLFRHPEIELVITDIEMPRLNGHELLIRIRNSGEEQIRQLPVIVLTATDDQADRRLAFSNGANDYVLKPIDEIELRARVHVHQRFAQTIRELEKSRRLLTEQASTDPLTHLKNRRAFFENGEKYLALARRYHSDLSVMVADLDHFKKINDTFGHHVGDEALAALARILASLTRAEDTVARIGGEEFALLLPDTNRVGAAMLAERIRVAVSSHPLGSAAKVIRLTVSVGVASLAADRAANIGELLRVADRRLYLAKEGGRNRVCIDDDGSAGIT